ncbi:PepSY-associated TM helix domain-containing protein [Actinokineospora spheciospongiae]|uniref:PepSY-associated TM helix domain-containing protein n=1 Tax=Actinokineospora spheciospongiae TaxID=909613 RepID=UPI0004B4DA1B|nr:PepSY domain-containing protein [Actinokineospora spheciospongiae]PWW58407.1 putative iron-regulated membrane protein [Actinokineospora spheciospongiae]
MTRARSTRTAVLLLSRRVHYLAGLAIAPFLFLLALTGLCYACAPQLSDTLYANQLFVHDASREPVPVSTQVRAALAAHPQDSVRQVTVFEDPERTTQVVLADPGIPEPRALAVHVDPYTAVVTGDYPTVDGRAPVQAWLGQLHTNLHLGEPGRLYAEFAVSWLPAVMLFGVLLWALGPKKRRQRLKATNPKIRIRAWHGLLGVVVVVGLLVINFSGLTRTMTAGERVQTALGTKPGAVVHQDVVPGSPGPVDLDTIVRVAHDSGLTGDLTLTPPRAYDEPFKVAESSPGLPMRKGVVLIDQYRGVAVGVQHFADYSLAGQLRLLAVAAHHGLLFGVANQLLLIFLALAILAVLAMGYRMWRQRKPAPAPPRALAKLPRHVLVPLVLVCALLGWLLPVFGVTLVAFLLWDALREAGRKSRTHKPKRRRAAHALPKGQRSSPSLPVVTGTRRRTPATPHPERQDKKQDRRVSTPA